ncbi:MAG: hypothetical protein R3B72_45815 [Polyangiaceae bacterium]
MSDSGETPPRRGPRALGRRVALGIYVAGILFVAGNATWQITKQVWFPDPPAEPAPFKGCEAGLRAFYRSIEGARVAARFSDPGGDRHEDRAVERFRAALAPLWRHRGQLAELCEGSPNEGLLDAIERLRYSEEHAVRHQAHELTTLRRRVDQLVAARLLGGAAPSPNGPPPLAPLPPPTGPLPQGTTP